MDYGAGDPRVLNAIHGRPGGSIGICFIEWSGEEEQRVVVDWAAVRDEEDAGVVAASILAPRSFTGRTSISSGIDFAVVQFARSKWQVERRIIDIFGDDTDNSGRSVTQARDQAVSTGLTINGLAIINDSPNLGYSGHSHPPGGLENYYRQNVIGGPNAFVMVVEDFKSFAATMANKPAKEIDVADPSAVGRISSRPSQ